MNSQHFSRGPQIYFVHCHCLLHPPCHTYFSAFIPQGRISLSSTETLSYVIPLSIFSVLRLLLFMLYQMYFANLMQLFSIMQLWNSHTSHSTLKYTERNLFWGFCFYPHTIPGISITTYSPQIFFRSSRGCSSSDRLAS